MTANKRAMKMAAKVYLGLQQSDVVAYRDNARCQTVLCLCAPACAPACISVNEIDFCDDV